MPRPALFLLLLIYLSGYSQQLPLYNGAEYTRFYHGVKGHPYYLSDSLVPGDLFYDGILYRKIPFNYNIADNEVLIKHHEYGYYIRLVSDKIGYFILDGHRFEKVQTSQGTQFFEIIYKNGVKVFLERTKMLKPSFSAEDPMQFVSYVKYFVPRNGRLAEVRRLRQIKQSMKGDSLLLQTAVHTPSTDNASPLQKKLFEENRLHEIGSTNAQPVNQQLSLAGYVKDAKSGEPVVGAVISADSLLTSVITDQFGYYAIKLLPGRHTITVSGGGVNETKRQVVLHEDGKLNIETSPQVGSLKAVVVIAEKNSRIKNPQMSVEKLAIKTIKQVPVVFGETDVLRVITTLPGVTTAGEAGAGFNVRGGSTDQNLILFNDATVYNPTHLFGFFSAFNPDIIKTVELYKSSIPEKFGGRLSSVLDITARDGNRKQISGNGGIGPLTSKLSIEGPLSFKKKKQGTDSKTSFLASGRTTYSNWLLRALPNERYNKSRASFQDFNLGITHHANSKNSFYITSYYSDDRFKLNNDTSYEYGNINANIKWKHIYHNKLYSVFTAGYDRYKYSVQSDEIPVNAFKLKFDINQVHLRTHFTFTPNNAHNLDFGMQSVYYKLHPGSFNPNSGQSLVAPDVLQTERALETALYLGDKYTITPDLVLDFGARYSIFNYLGPYNADEYSAGIPKDTSSITNTISYGKGKVIKSWQAPEFRLAARYTLSNTSSLKLAFNTTRQYIHMLSNTTIISPTDTWKLSDNNIRPQQGWQASAGYYQTLHLNVIETSVELYYKRMKNVLDYKSGARLIMNHHIAADVINATGKSYGAELMLRKVSGKLNGWLSYTYSRTLLQQDDSLAGEIINRGEYYPANFDKPHNVNFISNYRFTHRFSLSLNAVYTTGRPVTVPVAVFESGGSQRVFYSDRNQYRIPDYFRADVSFTIEGNHKIKQRAHNSWSFGVYNLTARKNPYSVYFKQENGSIKGYQLSIFGTIIPFITYNFRF
jgi:hypothetical protein